ncbi:MAG: citryl-CoA lyase [Chloroflexi bacterium RBG_16_48_8]|nr:MAG: citryl-CoA lyase [Chloroflexi bacterium RBG_16_48_8]
MRDVKPNEIRLRGYRIDDLMGHVTFSQAVYLALTGVLPSPEVAKLLDAMLVSSIDHGPTAPSAYAARTSASTGAPLNAAIGAGILSINRFHGAAISDGMMVLLEGIQRAQDEKKTLDEIAVEMIAEYGAQKKRIGGLGHRIHSDDPRTAKLFSLAKELGVAGQGVQMIEALHKHFHAIGKDLPINVDGALAAILVDLEIPPEIGNAFFIMARIPGLVAHIFEEQSRERPMRHIHPTDVTYDGPDPRSV